MKTEQLIRSAAAVLSAALTVMSVWWFFHLDGAPWWLRTALGVGIPVGAARTWEAVHALRTGRESPRAVQIATSVLVWTALLALAVPYIERALAE